MLTSSFGALALLSWQRASGWVLPEAAREVLRELRCGSHRRRVSPDLRSGQAMPGAGQEHVRPSIAKSIAFVVSGGSSSRYCM